MQSFKSSIVSLGLAVALALPLAASAQTAPGQPPQPPAAGEPAHHHGGHGFMRAMRGLNLSADQQARIKAIVTQFHDAHPRGSAPDPAARESLHQQIMAVLTPAQQAQFKANLAAAKTGSEQGEPPGAGEHPGPMHRFDSLGLSAQQKAKIETLMQQFRQAHPPGSARDPQAFATLHAQIRAVLTPAQQQQFDALMRDRMNDGPPHEEPPAGAPPSR